MNLHEAGVPEHSTTFVSLPGCTTVTSHRIGRQEEYIAITSGSQHYGMGSETLDFSGNEIPGDYSACFTVDDHDIQHFVAVVHFYFTGLNLTVHGSVTSQQQLLSGLATGIERTAYQSSTERTVGQ